VVIRDARPADVETLRDVFRRSSLSNEGDQGNLLAHPETLKWAEPVGDGRTRVAVGHSSRIWSRRPGAATAVGSR
jgi:hypothetical protein